MSLIKFAKVDNHLNNETEYHYDKIYEEEKTTVGGRLKIGAGQDQTMLLGDLLTCLEPPLFVLYVLIIDCDGFKSGRYESPVLQTRNDALSFLNNFKDYLESDGRHHLWVGTSDGTGQLIYDQHDVIFAYGPIDRFKEHLNKECFKETEFDFPFPHVHNFHSENNKELKRLMNFWDWERYDLEEGDEYD
ncbi:hypothetical protein [Jiulongibacter sp. NS-SX5]|uniref:hypothetical protein n=1 Tax=Jiulongibacter sp. NS-SX5 TaxID=3463854 RepID=UPI00405A24A8